MYVCVGGLWQGAKCVRGLVVCVVLLLNIQAICREIIGLEEYLILLYMLVLISSVGWLSYVQELFIVDEYVCLSMKYVDVHSGGTLTALLVFMSMFD